MKQLFTCLLFCTALIPVVSFNADAQTGKKKIQTSSQTAVNRIDSIIKTIQADTTLELATIKQKELVKTGSSNRAGNTIYAAYKNRQLAMLQSASNVNNFFVREPGNSNTIYFDKGEPILYIQQFNNSSRMGSCGNISVSFYHYIKDSVAFAGLAKSLTSFYNCYGYKLEQPGIKRLFAEADQQKNS